MNKTLKIILIIIGIVLLLWFLYPKYSGEAIPGLVLKGTVITRTDYSCFGIEYNREGDRWGRVAVDAGYFRYCIGIPYDKKCYEWTTGMPIETEIEVTCEK